MSIKDLLRKLPWSSPVLRPIYKLLKGVPPVSSMEITKEDIRNAVGRPDPIIFEIGCNGGEHTKWFLEIFENATVYCFEPDPRAIARFRKRIGDQSNVILTECALSAEEGVITFYQSDIINKDSGESRGYDGSGSIRSPSGHLEFFPKISFDSKIEVKTMTLDKFCEMNGIDRIDFIWMDVQGAEVDVINGGRKSFFENTRYLYTEYGLVEMFEGQLLLPDLLKHLDGFKVIHRYPTDILLKNKKLD